MRRVRLTLGGIGAALAVSAALLAGCGGDDEDPGASQKAPRLASTQVIDNDPYAIACGHVRNQQQWADTTRRASVALVARERIAGLNQLQATQSLFFAMTELCEGRPASYRPAMAAVRAVRQGKYRADLGAP
jgi:hypothetical protein